MQCTKGNIMAVRFGTTYIADSRRDETLRQNTVHVWWFATEGSEDCGEWVEMLSHSERLRQRQFALPEDRRDYAAAHALLRTALSRYGDEAPAAWVFDRTAYGKPYVRTAPAAAPLHFNLSHARGLVACVVSRLVNVGIDVERIDRLSAYPHLHERCLSPAERTHFAGSAGDLRAGRFTDLWTLKEALLKAIGVGLFAEPSQLSFDLRIDGAISPMLPPMLFQNPLHLALYTPSPRHRMAAAIEMTNENAVNLLARNAESGEELPVERSTGGVRPPAHPRPV
jgi:4'-phosphopantetheinyl transferase